jgi:hypothetical protein
MRTKPRGNPRSGFIIILDKYIIANGGRQVFKIILRLVFELMKLFLILAVIILGITGLICFIKF